MLNRDRGNDKKNVQSRNTTCRMRRLAAVGACGMMLLAACARGTGPVVIPGAIAPGGKATIRVQVNEGGGPIVRTVPLEEYVAGTVLSEVHPAIADESVAERMFEVQSIVARTYAAANRGRHAREGFDLCSTTHCQLYEPARLRTSRWAAAAREAGRTTAGEVLWFVDRLAAQAVFHADCGGHTSSATAVWGGLAPAYLRGQPDTGPAAAAHAEWTFQVRSETLREALNVDLRTAVGPTLDRIDVAGRDAAGRAETIVLHGTHAFVVRGEVFRAVVTRALGVKTLRSTLFTLTRSQDAFVFSGKGFGHGVGLCQAGALARLRTGAAPRDVLAYYFPGTSLHRR